jgi:lipopolysaccharide export system permease protein
MKILDIYIIKKFLGTFFYALSLLILIVIIFDISENIDRFIRNQAPLKAIIFDYYLNFIPYFINLFIYLFTFISVIFFTSKMATDTEIVAILSSGVSFYRFLRPYLIASTMLAVMSFYLGNFLIPRTNHTRLIFRDAYMKKLTKDNSRNIHIQIEPNVFVYVESFYSKSKIGRKFSIEKFNGQQLVYKLMAGKLIWDDENKKWKIKNWYERRFDTATNRIIFTKGKEIDTVLNLKPEDLYEFKENYEEMNYWELNAYIDREKEKGSLAYKKYEIEKYKRIAGPVAIIILTFIGVALSSRKVRGGIGLHLGAGIALTFSYILFMQMSTVFSTQGNLSPSIGAWIPNILYTVIGIYLLKKAPK